LTFDFGVQPYGEAPSLIRRVTGKVQSWVVDVAAGTVTVQFIDLTGDWDQLPALPAVIVKDPYNAGLTAEYVIDRIARAASAGAVSSWPAQRPNCVLAVGLRTSLWPEVGTLVTSSAPVFTHDPGLYGSGLVGSVVQQNYTLDSPVGANIFIEFFVYDNQAGAESQSPTITVPTSGTPTISFYYQRSATGANNGLFLIVPISGSPFIQTLHWNVTLSAGLHYVALKLNWPKDGATSASGTFYLDGASQITGLSSSVTRSAGQDYTTANIFGQATTVTTDGPIIRGKQYGGTITSTIPLIPIAGLQITSESSPIPNSSFVPQAILDQSLNPLQAVPAIDEGTLAWDELQNIAEAELGFVCRDNLGRLLFLNRNTITSQTPGRTIALTSLKSIQTSVGAATEYNDIAVDYTEYAWAAATDVFHSIVPWRVAAHSTQSWTRTLPDGVTAAVTNGKLTVLPDSTSPADGNHWYRASNDKFGNAAHDPISGTVTSLTPSTVQITFTNNSAHDAWLVSPASDLDIAPGTPAVWVGGIPVTPDNPTTVHVSYGTASPTFTVPSSGYRQDRDATQDFGSFLLGLLRTARPTYDGVRIVPDARLVVSDKVTVDVPLPDGSTAAVDMLIWGLSFSADFEQAAWDMSLDLRRVNPSGAWVLGVAGASELGLTTWLY
jgi:hypothetical protein